MHYYNHHIGDFDRATRHLTRTERSIYRDLMDVYYDTEQPLTLDAVVLCRKVLARTNEESTAVEQVLNEFFVKTPTGWYHERCEEELENFRASNSQKSVAGKASAAKRAAKRQQAINEPATIPQRKGNARSTPVEMPLNARGTASQLTNNQEPRTNNQEPVNPVTTPTQSQDGIRGQATPVELSLAFRKRGVNTQPADPRLHALSEQGISVATADAACDEARKSLGPDAAIALGYVVKIVARWSTEGRALNVTGAVPPRAASAGYESQRDRERRETLEGLTGSGKEPPREFTDINRLA